MDQLFEMIMVEKQKQELQSVLACNEKTEIFGLTLLEKDAQELVAFRRDTLKESQRVEFGEGILPKLIFTFCDSQYINQSEYVETLSQLQEVFYLYKNEAMDAIPDDELLDFMKTQFEEICCGDIEYLRSTCLERFARAVRSGYRSKRQKRHRDEYTLRETENEYSRLSEETRWDFELYKTRLEDTY